MIGIDEIMNMLDWNNASEVQAEGRALAKGVKCINVFLQPRSNRYPEYNKNVWDNCAKILSDRPDEELEPYLIELFEWIEDLNWPGAICILERLNHFDRNKFFDVCLSSCIKRATLMEEEIWLENLLSVKKNI